MCFNQCVEYYIQSIVGRLITHELVFVWVNRSNCKQFYLNNHYLDNILKFIFENICQASSSLPIFVANRLVIFSTTFLRIHSCLIWSFMLFVSFVFFFFQNAWFYFCEWSSFVFLYQVLPFIYFKQLEQLLSPILLQKNKVLATGA